MPLKQGHGVGKPEISVVVGIGLGVAAVAGLAASAAIGTGVLAVGVASTMRGAKQALKASDVKWDAEGRIVNWPHVLKIVQQGGVAPNFRAEIWPFLLGVFSAHSTTKDRTTELTRLQNLYTKLVLVCKELETQIEASKKAQEAALLGANSSGSGSSANLGRVSSEPAPLAGNLAAFAEAHRIIVLDAVRTDMRLQPSDLAAAASTHSPTAGSSSATAAAPHTTSSRSSLDAPVPTVTVLPVSVGEGLPELMFVDPPQPEPAEAVASGQVPVWRSVLAASTIDGATHVTPAMRRQMMRLVNILSAYAVHDPESGYCQGMSDLAAAFVQLIESDALAFACFERLMRDARRNFRHDETGIKTQLQKVSKILADTDPTLHKKLTKLGAADCTFAYRMVLVMLRRELPLGEALTLWEVKWALQAAVLAEAELNSAKSNGYNALTTAGSSGPMAVIAGTGVSSSSRENSPGSTPKSSSAVGLAATVASLDAATKAALAEGEAAGAAKGGGGGNGSSAGGSSSQPTSLAKSLLGGGGMRHSGSGNSRHIGHHNQQQQEQKQPPPPDFILQFVAAAVRAQRNKVLTECHESDDVLRLFNSVQIDFWTALGQARKQHKAYAQGIAVLQRLYS